MDVLVYLANTIHGRSPRLLPCTRHPFCIWKHNAPGADMLLGQGEDRQPVTDRFTAEITQFAHHGHPSWSQYDTDTRATLRIDEKTELILDPEQEIRALFSQ